MNRKVTVVGGAGNVGATVARAIAVKELADVVIVDIAARQGAGHRARHLPGLSRSTGRTPGWSARRDYAATADSDVVVITSGVPRKPGMSRDDLLQVNYKIMQAVTEQVVKYSPNCIIVPVANPLDAMCQAVYRLSGFPRERVIGMAGVLDSARMRTFIAMELNVSVENVHAFVLGGHGDTMVPLPRYSTVAGIPHHRTACRRSKHRRDLHADRQRRRRDHEARRHERLVRAGRRGGRDGRGDPQGQEADPAVLGLPAGRVRRPRPVPRRAGQARQGRRRADHRDQADGRRAGGAR